MTYVTRHGGDSTTVTDAALAHIVVQAAEAASGARVRRARRKLGLEIQGDRATVTLELAVEYGKVLPEVAREVQERVADALTRMCGLDVAAVDVTVEALDR
ncbi:MAG TPA: Asp23/Gls24 family envelope stress response protein [Gaiellaceae bacterium]|nr:Asp23/Gls24 family envelope stress response protein [Gaiellaceae bacterium]